MVALNPYCALNDAQSLSKCSCAKWLIVNQFSLGGCMSCWQEKRNEKIQNMHSVMANLNLGQDMTNKIEREYILPTYIVAKSYALLDVVWMLRYSSLININPLIFRYQLCSCSAFFFFKIASVYKDRQKKVFFTVFIFFFALCCYPDWLTNYPTHHPNWPLLEE